MASVKPGSELCVPGETVEPPGCREEVAAAMACLLPWWKVCDAGGVYELGKALSRTPR